VQVRLFNWTLWVGEWETIQQRDFANECEWDRWTQIELLFNYVEEYNEVISLIRSGIAAEIYSKLHLGNE
jgi:hypothetical protein